MYLRTVTGKTKKDGIVRYLQLAHNTRHPVTGAPTAHILYNFGREDQVDRAALERLVGSITRFLEPTRAADVHKAIEVAGLEFVRSRTLGGCWALDRLWTALGIDKAIIGVLGEQGMTAEVERALFAMVANRALAPASKLSVTDWLARSVFLPGWSPPPLPADVSEQAAERKRRVNRLYQAMDVLAAVEPELQREVFWSICAGDLLNLEVDLLYFDTTSTYWETETADGDGAEEDADDAEAPADEGSMASAVSPHESEADGAVRRKGHSQDHRPDLPQIVIGLAVTRSGIPIRCWTWPGNTVDVTVVEQVKRDLIGWKLGRVIPVVDRGFTSEENLKTLQLQGGHYIAGEKMRSGKTNVKVALSRQGRYQVVRDNLEVKQIVVGAGEARQRFILVRNPHEAERDRKRREQTLAELREALAHLGEVTGSEHTKAVCRLRAHVRYGRYLTTDAKGRLKIDAPKVRAETRLDGKYLLRTSDDTLTPEDVALGYRQLLEVESAFRTLKSTLELRPVYHHVEQRVRAHVVLCWLALLLVRVAEVKTGRRWPALRRDLDEMHVIDFRGPDGEAAQRTATTSAQRQILAAIGIPEPPQVFRVSTSTASTA